MRKLCRTSLLISGGVVGTDWMWLAVCMCAGQILLAYGCWLWLIPAHLFVLWPLCSRALRGLENLTHEGSHYNMDRQSKARNDRFVNWTCAFWVLLSVEMFRVPHEAHHKYFGSDGDPDKKRFDHTGVDDMPRHSPLALCGYLLRVLPTYVLNYWRQFSDKKSQLMRSLALHALLMGLMSWAIHENFWLLWLVYFWIPFSLYLPAHRFLAEAEEHRYKDAETEFGATFSNLSRPQRWFLHPHGDAYHLLHHMLPQIPHWKMAFAHWLLFTLDASFQGGRYRASIFDDPRHYFNAVPRRIPAAKGGNDESALRSGTF